MLLEQPKHSDITFSIVVDNVFPVFPAKSTLTLRDISITKLQIPMTSDLAVTDYKVQRATFQTTVLDLYRKSNSESGDLHKKFYSIYV